MEPTVEDRDGIATGGDGFSSGRQPSDGRVEQGAAHRLALGLHRRVLMICRVAAVLCLLLPATAIASPPDQPAAAQDETSYRAYTLAADAFGLGLFMVGGLSEGRNGRDTTASDALFTSGLLVSYLVTPGIHLARGHRGRAIGSFFMRWGLSGTGAMLSILARSGCHDSAQSSGNGDALGGDLLCELDYIGYGVLGGLVVASIVDAAVMTDERALRASWSPVVSANRDGVRVGAAFLW